MPVACQTVLANMFHQLILSNGTFINEENIADIVAIRPLVIKHLQSGQCNWGQMFNFFKFKLSNKKAMRV